MATKANIIKVYAQADSAKKVDITGNSAIASVMTREALVACDFSGDVLEGVDRQEEFKQEAFTLRTMRLDYELFNQQLGILGEEESEVFQQFIRGEKDLQAIAENKGISAKCRKSKEILSYPLTILFFETDKIGLQMWNRRHYNGLESKLSIDFYSKIMRTGYSSFNIGGMKNGCY